jgi:hypothetical protein
MGWINECGAASGMRIGRGNLSTPRKPTHPSATLYTTNRKLPSLYDVSDLEVIHTHN